MALKDRVSKKVIEAVAGSFKKEASEITPQTRLHDELGATSLNFVELMAVFEAEFEVAIPFARMQRCQTVGEVIDLVMELLQG